MIALVVPDGFTREELLACVEREIRMRERVYGRGPDGMTAAQKRELDRMRAVLAVLRQLPAPPPAQSDLFGGGR